MIINIPDGTNIEDIDFDYIRTQFEELPENILCHILYRGVDVYMERIKQDDKKV